NAGTQDEGQAGSNPDETSKGQAGPDPGNAGAEVQSILSPMVHAGSDREHMDLDVVDVSPQPSTEQLDEGFTATAYPKVQENLKKSIHTFIEDKWNLSRHTTGKKRATMIVIPSIWFTKLIIHHLQRRYRFHPKPDSPFHLPNEEPILGYLKFSAKGSKREVFGMPIPGSLITSAIQTASYYQEYLASVAKHKKYLAGETGSHLDSPAPMPTKPARKPKYKAPKAPPMPSVSIPVSKKHTLKHVVTSEAEDVPIMEPRVAAEDAELQKVLEESIKTTYAATPWGPLPPVVIREPESGKYQPLPEVPKKGKAKVTEEQVAHDLLSLQKTKKKIPTDQYIFQRRISKPAGSSLHDKSPYVVLGQSDSEEESEKVVFRDTEEGKDEDQDGPDPGAQAEGQTGSNAGTQDKGQAGSNPDETSEGQAGPDPGNAGAEVKSIPSHVVHAGSDHEHMDLDVADVTPQPSTEQIDEGFTATAYPKVQENLKLAIEEQVLLEDLASSSGTLSSLQHLSKDISFGDLFFSDKPSKADNGKTTTKTEVESMVSVTIQQDMSSIPPMTSPIIDLSSRPESPKVHQQFKATTTKTTTTTATLPPPPTQQQSNAEAMMRNRIGKLKHIMTNLIQVNKDMEESACGKPNPTKLMKTTQLFEALEKSMNRDHSEELAQDLAEARKKKKKSRESPKTPPRSPPHHPPPPPPPVGSSGASGAPGASGSSQPPPPPPPPPPTTYESPSKGSAPPSSSQTVASAEYQVWTTTGIRLRPSISVIPADLKMDEDMGLDEQAQLLDDEDIRSAHIPKVNLTQDLWKPLEEERPATPEPVWSISLSDAPVPPNNWASALASSYSPPPEDSLLAQTGPAFVKVFHPDVIHLQYQMVECHKLLTDCVDDPIIRHNVSKPLPLGGPPGQVSIQSDFFFNKDLEYLRYSSKGNIPALSILKMKAAYYPDAGLEEMVPDQFWIEEECKYNIAAMYVKTHMHILSVVRIEVFSLPVSVKPSRSLEPPPTERQEDSLTIVNQWTIHLALSTSMTISSSIEIHKFSDGTLQQIDEALDYRVKEFRINMMNPGLNMRFWTRKDVHRCKAFMFAIQRRLKTRRIFRNLESFVGGRVREEDYRLLKRTE
nr:histone deacetylase 14 [Tanacetum cinerariifolium]